MRWIKTLTAVVATLGLNVVSQAGILDLVSHEGGQCGEQACVEKAPECKPTIQRPCETKLFNYQRQVCEKAPPSCKPECVAPAPSAACAPAAKPCAPKAKPCVPPPCPKKKACGKKDGCGDGCVDRCCDADPCEIAELIFQSQTACYAKDRRKAIDKLGDKFDCVCNPEIMAAFIYALNDTDERVRAEAADEIGDQIRKSDGCCCTQEVVEALTAALADCDPKVRRQAEEALEACGYEVVDGCCKKKEKCVEGDKCVADKCAPAAPAPAPESKALVPTPSVLQQTSATIKGRLSRIFDLLD